MQQRFHIYLFQLLTLAASTGVFIKFATSQISACTTLNLPIDLPENNNPFDSGESSEEKDNREQNEEMLNNQPLSLSSIINSALLHYFDHRIYADVFSSITTPPPEA